MQIPEIPESLTDCAFIILTTADAEHKAELSRAFISAWKERRIKTIGTVALPDRPARPEKPELLDPRDMPKRRKGGSDKTKAALLHALAHIELNAIDLAWDVMARFSNLSWQSTQNKSDFKLPKSFYDDWCKVADDEAKHFLMLNKRMKDFNAEYGSFPAHDGLWESAVKTAHDFPARLAVVPMVLEARGLDVTPGLIDQMRMQGDEETARLFQIIHDDEITHVRAGTVWFEAWCDHYKLDIEKTWQDLVVTYFNGRLKRPFNDPSRLEAGMLKHWYEPLADSF